MNTNNDNEINIQEPNSFFHTLAERWGHPFVPRSKVGIFSGGLLHPRTMANLDSLGLGPGKITHGHRVVYQTSALIEWMERRTTKHAA